ncbi:hypothetical protein COW46_02060 [Candidatus Gracilibacteria bacterium CG17_big_fil_post_rev_8_21_14_2_50_48_13]|nr:MAG: hypothetical protein COW46_02060 [Candidatus Gracilibacteria bacterium CG17_big_fil_post_rev_8_21_14_2_50_48_13]
MAHGLKTFCVREVFKPLKRNYATIEWIQRIVFFQICKKRGKSGIDEPAQAVHMRAVLIASTSENNAKAVTRWLHWHVTQKKYMRRKVLCMYFMMIPCKKQTKVPGGQTGRAGKHT